MIFPMAMTPDGVLGALAAAWIAGTVIGLAALVLTLFYRERE